ncbi:MAG: transglycosylase SLT domain-containing protein [Bdellovibrionales bacterium]|nr:transglycosylase SLT domain-containing protein [Bdellovibrionales bacterium]
MTWYLQLNLALFAFGSLAILASFLNISSRQKLKFHYLMIVLCLLVLPTLSLVPEASYEYPIRNTLGDPLNATTQGLYLVHESIAKSSIPKTIPYRYEYISYLIYLIIFGVSGLIPWKTIKTYKEIHRAFTFKKIGNTHIKISDRLYSPYAFSFLKNSYIVLPQFLLQDMGQLKLALKHEFQHIKNRDTGWIYLFEMILSLCFLNPIVYLWRKQVLLDQEFACDESLIARKKVLPRAYAACLIQVAETTHPHKIPYGASGMAWGKMKSQLSRRIEKMKNIKQERKPLFSTIVAAGILLFGLSVFALQSSTNKITMTQLRDTVNVNDFDGFPIEVNDQVLEELNRFSSNNNWREFTRKSLKRYEAYKSLIDSKAEANNLPSEIAAVAFVESGFKNLPDRRTSISSKGAGMWQFIPNTARRYGLTVNENRDERLDIPLATDAAMRYLRDNNLKFNDLRLTLISYYQGENRVLKDIVKYGTRDPWTLIEQGNYQTPYLARVMAAAILIKYPSLVL